MFLCRKHAYFTMTFLISHHPLFSLQSLRTAALGEVSPLTPRGASTTKHSEFIELAPTYR